MSESTITVGAPWVTFINVFTVAPEQQTELVDLLTRASADVMSKLPGFVSGNFHASTDGTTVINYVQWESAETLAAAQQDPAAQAHMQRAVALAESIEPRTFRVVAVHHRSQSSDGEA